MKNATNMTGKQLVAWMDKEIKTIKTTHGMTKGDSDSKRFQIRAAKFDKLKEELVERGAWIEYCDSRGLEHDFEATDCLS